MVPDEDFAARIERLRRLAEEAAERERTRRPVNLARDIVGAAGGTAGHDEAGDGPVPIERLVTGQEIRAAGKACFVRDSVLDLDHRHGRWPLAIALEARLPELERLAYPSAITSPSLKGAIFIDVETTGLAGGTGTLAFLVGAAWFESGRLELVQYLMRSPDEEPAVLAQLAARARASEVVVSFNGKAFDIPLLETRYIMARQRPPFPDDHLDLLSGSRRVWRLRLESCRLAHLEERVLGVRRWDDVPGWLIPQLYTDYLRTGDGRCLLPVFDHNALDVLSLVTLAGRLACLHRDPLLALEDDPLDLVSLGRAFERAGGRTRPQRRCTEATAGAGTGTAPGAADDAAADLSTVCYDKALAVGLEGPGADLARLRLAAIHKRRGRYDDAEALWLALAETAVSPEHRFAAMVELAKYNEHRRRDPARALAWVLRAEKALRVGEARRRELDRRMDRLTRKTKASPRIAAQSKA